MAIIKGQVVSLLESRYGIPIVETNYNVRGETLSGTFKRKGIEYQVWFHYYFDKGVLFINLSKELGYECSSGSISQIQDVVDFIHKAETFLEIEL